jgi:hypothetical protein
LYSQKLLEAFGAEVETSAQQIEGSYITAQDQETAETFLSRLEAGETFEALVTEIQADESESPVARAGRFSWSPVENIEGRFGKEFATVAFETSAGSYTQSVVSTSDGLFYLIYVQGNEVRELADYVVEQRGQEAYQNWLDEQEQGDGIVYGDWHPYIPHEPSL